MGNILIGSGCEGLKLLSVIVKTVVPKNRPARNELGVRIPVVACLKDNNNTRYVRLGDQFCVKDTELALDSLSKNSFIARTSKSLVI